MKLPALFPLVVSAALLLCGCRTVAPELHRFEYTQPQMGVPFRLVLYAPARASADAAAQAAFARIGELNAVMSDYDTDSELSRLSQTAGQGKTVPVSEELWRILQRAQQLASETDGAFDITSGPFISRWRKARREGELPDPAKLEQIRSSVGYDKLRLNARHHTAELLVPYMRLDLGAIATGLAVDEALRTLRDRGITRALVSGGGDMAVGDPPPGAEGWRIELAPSDLDHAPPAEFVLLRNRALATSGDMFQHVEIGGVRYSHIVDPRTGLGLTDHSLVIVIARDCTTADSLSTAVSVLGPESGLRLAERKGACARTIRQPGAQVEIRQSPCFGRFLSRPKENPHSKPSAGW